ncbi:MAG: sulfatase [Acidobacteriota bacterium]|nr:sulfatase [Acidobacteriota bacterium]
MRSFRPLSTSCWALAATLLLATGCAPQPDAEQGPTPELRRPNVLLLSIDTLRADHLGSYGYSRDTSPRLDALAAEGARFEQVYAPTPWTLPSHASLLTGVHAYDLGMRHKKSGIPDEAPRLARSLAEAGYDTAAWVDSSPNGYVGADRGFDQGFEQYHHAPHGKDLPYKYDMAVTADRAVEWLEERTGEEPFFLFLHTKSVHALPPNTPCIDHRCLPYDKPEPYRFRFIADEQATSTWKGPEMGQGQQYLWALNRGFLDGSRDPDAFPDSEVEVLQGTYDAGIYYTDEHFGRVLDALQQLDLYDDTLIVVTSDHGEAFLEHNLLMHQEVYEQAVWVPLIVKPAQVATEGTDAPTSAVPAGAAEKTSEDPARSRTSTATVIPGAVIAGTAELSDIAPTVLELLSLPIPAAVTGHALSLAGPMAESLAGPLAADAPLPPREVFSYYLFPPTFTYRAFALRHGDYTLIHHNFGDVTTLHPEIFRNGDDPYELTPLDTPEAETIRTELLSRLRQRLAQPPLFEPVLVEEDEEAIRELKTLGYID